MMEVGLPVVVVVRRGAGKVSDARARIERGLDRATKSGRMSPERAAAARTAVDITDDFAQLGDCHVVIESIDEDLDRKRALLAALEDAIDPNCVVATTSTAIPASVIGRDA